MERQSVDNPVHELGNAVAELYKAADMAEIIIEAIFNGDGVTLQAVGNSMDVFLSQLRERIVTVEMLNEAIGRSFPWAYDARGGDTDGYCRQGVGEYPSGRKEAGQDAGDPEPCSNELAFVELLPEDQKDKLCTLLEEVRVASRKQGVIEGYKAAVGRCAGNGDAGNWSEIYIGR